MALADGCGMRIGLFFDDLFGWYGGAEEAGLIYECLLLSREPTDEIVVVSKRGRDSLFWRAGRAIKHLARRHVSSGDGEGAKSRHVARDVMIRGFLGPSAQIVWLPRWTHDMARWVRRHADVAGPFWTDRMEWAEHLPWVGFLPDCQHKHLPHFFSAEELARRERLDLYLLDHAPVVLVKSRYTRNDVLRSFGHRRAEVIVLPLAAAPRREWFAGDLEATRLKYQLPKNYFICSNQFWAHKNHGIVLEALRLARAEGQPCFFAFTGTPYDDRDPGYFGRLMQKAKDTGVADDFKVLGLIPKLDQISLMRAARSVVQPSLFEGNAGGLSSHDAISVGQRLIVSDIPINREIETYVDHYFNPTDARALLDIMRKVGEPSKMKSLPDELIRLGIERRRECGRVLRAAFSRAIERVGQAESTR
jgi:glycosyltransferase involved in cell wall biosynthesis